MNKSEINQTKWRVIVTDTYADTGIAPVCNHADHPRDDPGAGVYDCCPWPQIELWDDNLAQHLVDLLNGEPDWRYWRDWHITTRVNGLTWDFKKPISDPFVNQTIRLRWRDLLRLVWNRQGLEISVIVGAKQQLMDRVLWYIQHSETQGRQLELGEEDELGIEPESGILSYQRIPKKIWQSLFRR